MVRLPFFLLFFTRRTIFELQLVLVWDPVTFICTHNFHNEALNPLGSKISSLPPLPLPLLLSYYSRVGSMDLQSLREAVVINAIGYSQLGWGFLFHRILASCSAEFFSLSTAPPIDGITLFCSISQPSPISMNRSSLNEMCSFYSSLSTRALLSWLASIHLVVSFLPRISEFRKWIGAL